VASSVSSSGAASCLATLRGRRLDKNRPRQHLKQTVRPSVLGPDPICLTRIVTLAQAHQTGSPPQHAPSATVATTATGAASSKAYIPYQPRLGTFPYAIGTWGYHHYPSNPNAATPSSAPPVAPQGDSATNSVASGTFTYPYAGVQYTTTYVPPQIKYPYGAPVATPPPPSSPTAGVTSSSSVVQDQSYNGIQWKQPYAAEPQAQESTTSTTGVRESTSTPNPGGVASITDNGNAPPPSVDLVPSSTEITV
jgi:hypothetical protein